MTKHNKFKLMFLRTKTKIEVIQRHEKQITNLEKRLDYQVRIDAYKDDLVSTMASLLDNKDLRITQLLDEIQELKQ